MREKIPHNIKPILEEVKKRLKETYGNRLRGIILYGSFARGDATEGSDIDLIVLLKDMNDTVDEILKCSNAFGDLELTYDTLISVLPLDANEFRRKRLPVILNAKREGVSI
jgi:predicted nucleotidyltransferase